MGLFSKFPSYDYLIKGVYDSLRRFPLALLSAAVSVFIAIYLIDADGKLVLQKLLMASILGLPLFIALAAYAEKMKWQPSKALLTQASGLVPIALYYFSLPVDVMEHGIHLSRFLVLNIGLHFLVAFIPYIGGNQVSAFWQFNKSLFLRFLLAALYSAVMFIGLAIALAAGDYLFGIEVKEIRYLQLWVLIAGLFNTWVFLAGIPKDLEFLEGSVSYPKGLKLFTQYILLPLVVLYFVILIAYEAKIVATWNWPKGWVSELVLWFSVVGILSLLLLHPLRELAKNRWIKQFGKWFYITLIPLVIMLVLAITRRISDYGITENRYFVFGLAAGLSIVTLYFIFSKAKDIRIIPIVLCCLAILSAYGPWSAFSVSLNSQMSRLEGFLIENKLLVDGDIQKAEEIIPFKARKQMSNIISYLTNSHGAQVFSEWIPDSALAAVDTIAGYSQASEMTQLFGFEFVGRRQSKDDTRHFWLNSGNSNLIDISNYDYYVELDNLPLEGELTYFANDDGSNPSFYLNDVRYFVLYDTLETAIKILRCAQDQEDSLEYVSELFLADTLRSLDRQYHRGDIPFEQMSFDITGSDFDSKIILRQVDGSYKGDSISVSSIDADLFIREK